MSFANQKSVLLHDGQGNIYNFYWNEDKIIFNYFDKSKGKYLNETLVEEANMEFDCLIDTDDKIYLILQKKNGQLLLMTKDDQWETSELSRENQPEVYNLNIFINKTLQIIYCVSSYESNNNYRIYHHSLEDKQWKTQQLEDISTTNLLNPFQIIQIKDRISFAYYDLFEGEEQIFIKAYDTEARSWNKPIRLTSSHGEKLYLDLFVSRPNMLHLTYSEFMGGNLVIKYEKYKMSRGNATKVLEHVISNPTNCSHPTFIWAKDILWVCWTEHDQVASCYSEDEGLTWSNPYLWKESKNINFFRHKFQTNDINIRDYYDFNNAFGKGYPEYSFMGFGNTDSATEVALNKKKEDYFEDKVEEETIPFIEESVPPKQEVNREKSEIEKLKENFQELDNRVGAIEEYLNRRRRGIFSTRN